MHRTQNVDPLEALWEPSLIEKSETASVQEDFEEIPVVMSGAVLPSGGGRLEMMVYRLDLQSNAQTWAAQDEGEIRRRAVTAARDMNVAALWDLLEANLILNGLVGAKVSPHTLRAYRKGLSTFLEFAQTAGVQLLRPRPNHGAAYARWLEGQGYNTSTVRVRLAAARKLFAALRWAGATDATPFADVRPAPDPVPRTEKRKPYTQGEVETLLRRADLEEKVILLLGAHAGLRVSEIAGLRRADIHLQGEHPHLMVTGKRQKRQGVPLSQSLQQVLQAWLAGTPQLTTYVIGGQSSDYVQGSGQGGLRAQRCPLFAPPGSRAAPQRGHPYLCRHW